MTSIRVTHATFGTNGQTTGQTMKSTSSVAGSVPATTLHHTSGNTLPSETPETNIEILVALLADEQRIQAESKARVDSYKAQLTDLYAANLIGDNVVVPGYSLTRVTRTTYAYDFEVEAQIETLKSMARIDGQATEKQSVSWTLRSVKSKET